MKEGFDNCSELKETCGSQFLQYLAKTALVSRLALNEQKLAICNQSFPMSDKCAGCHMPAKSTGAFEECRYGCGQTVKCDWKFCKGSEDVHSCATCGAVICRENSFIRYCRKCNKGLCRNRSCFSFCQCCSPICLSCSDATTVYIIPLGGLLGVEKLLCNLHKEIMDQDATFILSCKQCAPYKSDLKRCRDSRCWRFICPHKGPHKLYCQEHAADHK